MVEKSDKTLGFLGIGAIVFGSVSLFLGGLLSVFIGLIGVALGFFGAKKQQIFSVEGMMCTAVSLIFFNLVSIGIIKPPLSLATGKSHLANSIYASIDAFEVLRHGSLDDKETNKLLAALKKGTEQANFVNLELIEEQVSGFSLHYKEEFIKGMNLLSDGYEHSDTSKKIQGGLLLDKWGLWNNENNKKLDQIKEPPLSIFVFIKEKIVGE